MQIYKGTVQYTKQEHRHTEERKDERTTERKDERRQDKKNQNDGISRDWERGTVLLIQKHALSVGVIDRGHMRREREEVDNLTAQRKHAHAPYALCGEHIWQYTRGASPTQPSGWPVPLPVVCHVPSLGERARGNQSRALPYGHEKEEGGSGYDARTRGCQLFCSNGDGIARRREKEENMPF